MPKSFTDASPADFAEAAAILQNAVKFLYASFGTDRQNVDFLLLVLNLPGSGMIGTLGIEQTINTLENALAYARRVAAKDGPTWPQSGESFPTC